MLYNNKIIIVINKIKFISCKKKIIKADPIAEQFNASSPWLKWLI